MAGGKDLEDRLLALLARHPFPLTQREMSALFAIGSAMASRLCTQCVKKGSIVLLPPTGTWARRGPREKEYQLPGFVRSSPPPSPKQRLEPDMIVVTPLNRDARVIRVNDDGMVDLEILHEQDKMARFITLHSRLLLPYVAGRARPAPVRIAEG